MKTQLASATLIALFIALAGSAFGQEQREKLPVRDANSSSLQSIPDVRRLNSLEGRTEAAVATIEELSLLLPNDPIDANLSPDLRLPDTSDYGEFTVEQRTFYDAKRNRTISSTIYVPVRATIPAPVLVFAQGFISNANDFAELTEHLVSRGFAVAAITDSQERVLINRAEPVSKMDRQLQPSEFIERPRDVSFLLDELERINRSQDRFGIYIDLEKVGVIGHSFGGYTALALAGAQLDKQTLNAGCQGASFASYLTNPSLRLQCRALQAADRFDVPLKDERVLSVMALNPIGSSLFGRRGLSQIDIPVLMVAGSQDSVAPALLEQLRMFAWLEHPDEQPRVAKVRGRDQIVTSYPQHYLVLIEGGKHLYSLPENEDSGLLIGDLVTKEADTAYDYLRALGLAFLNVEVADYDGFGRGLTREALQRWSQPALPLHVTGVLSEDMLVFDLDE